MEFEEFVYKISRNEVFTFSRWGDGEASVLLGDKGQNCDGVQYTPSLAYALRNVVSDNNIPKYSNYHFGLLGIARTYGGERLQKYFKKNTKIQWEDGDFLTNASKLGKLLPLIQVLRSKRVLYVGPKHLRSLGQVGAFEISKFVEVPLYGAFEEEKRICSDIIRDWGQTDLIAVSMGIGAKVLIHNLYKVIGQVRSIVDFGSTFDGYVGVYSRKYFMDPAWTDIRRRNLGEIL